MQQTDHKTWATLRPDTPFSSLFPDRQVPIRSVIPIVPREEGAPPCYMVEGNLLADEQLRALAGLLLEMWSPECESIDQAIAYIRDGLPLRCEWFNSVTTTNIGMMLSMAELGYELRQADDEPDDDDDDFDDENYW